MTVGLVDLLVAITETPAPTFQEERRAELVASLWQAAGHRTRRDDAGNVVCLVDGDGPTVALVAHLDSVFGPEVPIAVRRERGKLLAPGIGDNAASLAVLTRLLQDHVPGPGSPRLYVAATVGEEGVGDLKGARQLVGDIASECDHFVAVDGYLGTMTHQAVGSLRYRATFTGPGGHAWGDYPGPSAAHAAGTAVGLLARLAVPSQPRSSLNVGQLWGGTSINAIAETAGFNLDLRSLDAATLGELARQAERLVASAATDAGCGWELRQIGSRPAATVDNAALLAAGARALASEGLTLTLAAGSTDANPAMAAGLSAAAFGVYRGGSAHRLEEWLDPTSLEVGVRALRRLVSELGRPAGEPAEGA